MQLKRLWDTDGKKIVYTEGPTGHKCQVWTDENGNLYIYDMAQWLTYNGVSTAGEEYVRSNWVELTDQMVGFYDTNEPTDLYNRDHGDEAYYQFVDWDGTVLKSGTVDEGETPTAPADPTRAATAQYTYTFAGWNPAVGKIYKRTTFTATYTATVNKYTVSISSNDTDYGTVDVSTATVDYGTAISASGNVLTIGTGESATVVTATAETGYEFSSWGELPATVTEALSITATFASNTPFTPGANTLFYYPFSADQDDVTENTSIGITGTQEALGYSFSSTELVSITDATDACRFISFWMKYVQPSEGAESQSPSMGGGVAYNISHSIAGWGEVFQTSNQGGGDTWLKSDTVPTDGGTWYHYVMGYDGTNVVCYLNGQNVWTQAASPSFSAPDLLKNVNMTISDFIGESVCWSAQDIATYFDATKSTYGYSNL